MAREANNTTAPLAKKPAQLRRAVNAAVRVAQLRRSTTLLGVAVIAAVFYTVTAFAQVSKEYQLKAVFLWRLAQFTQWPSESFESSESPIVICVVGENPFGEALEESVLGETAHGRRMVVRLYRVIEQGRSCHIVYVAGGAGPRRAKEISAALAGRSVLTVRDADGLPSSYETIVTFITEENKIKLRINVQAAKAARLVLDPRLLRAAEIVGD